MEVPQQELCRNETWPRKSHKTRHGPVGTTQAWTGQVSVVTIEMPELELSQDNTLPAKC